MPHTPSPLGSLLAAEAFTDELDCYSCFEKGCPTKPCTTMWKGVMGNGGLWFLDCVFRCFSDRERNSTNKCSYAFSFLVAKHRDP